MTNDSDKRAGEQPAGCASPSVYGAVNGSRQGHPRLDAKDVADGADGGQQEEDGARFMRRHGGGGAIVGHIERDIGNAVIDQEMVHVEGILDRHRDVCLVVEQQYTLISTGCPSLTDIVGAHGLEEALREGRVDVKHGRRDVVGHHERPHTLIDFLAGVAFAEDPLVEMA